MAANGGKCCVRGRRPARGTRGSWRCFSSPGGFRRRRRHRLPRRPEIRTASGSSAAFRPPDSIHGAAPLRADKQAPVEGEAVAARHGVGPARRLGVEQQQVGDILVAAGRGDVLGTGERCRAGHCRSAASESVVGAAPLKSSPPTGKSGSGSGLRPAHGAREGRKVCRLSPLEGDGLELPVRGTGESRYHSSALPDLPGTSRRVLRVSLGCYASHEGRYGST